MYFEKRKDFIMKKNKVSLIIPVYNSALYIEKCLESIVNQTYKNIEVIAIDDGSKDQSLKLLKRYAKKYNYFKVYSQKNLGVAKTRNKAVSLATGDYIMFVDNDDFLEKDYIERYITEILETKSDILIGGYQRVNSKNKVLFYAMPKNTSWGKYIVVAPWAKIYKKQVLLENQAEFLNYPIGEDVYFSLNLYSKNIKINTFQYIGYNWFYNELSVSNTTQKGFNENIDILFLLNKLWEIKERSNKEQENMSYYIYQYSIWYLLFSGRNATNEAFIKEFNIINAWLKEKKLKFKIPKSVLLKYKLPIIIFTIIIKLKCVKLFSKIYCKG